MTTQQAAKADDNVQTTTIDVDAALAAHRADLADAWHEAFEEIVFRAHSFGGKRQIDGAETTVNGVKIDDDLVDKARAKLIPDELSRPWDLAVSRLRGLLAKYCRRADDPAHWYVSRTKNPQFVGLFDDMLAEAERAAEAIAAAHATIVAKARERWLVHFKGDEKLYHDKIGRHLPPTALHLRSCYRIDYFPVVRDETRRKYAVGPLEEFFRRAYANYESAAREARKARYADVLADIRESVSRLAERLGQDKAPPASVESVLSQLEGFSIVADVLDPELYAQIEQLRAALDKSHTAGRAMLDVGGRYWQTVRKDRAALTALAARLVADCDSALSRLSASDDLAVPDVAIDDDDDDDYEPAPKKAAVGRREHVPAPQETAYVDDDDDDDF